MKSDGWVGSAGGRKVNGNGRYWSCAAYSGPFGGHTESPTAMGCSGRSTQPSRRVSGTLTPPDSNCRRIRCDRVNSMWMHVAEISTSVVGARDSLNVIDNRGACAKDGQAVGDRERAPA